MPRRPAAVLILVALLCAAHLAAQESAPTPPLPTCAELGVTRVIVMMPPGKTVEEVTAGIQASGMIPRGGQAVLIPTGQLTRILNAEQLSTRITTTLDLLLERQTSIDGSLSILMRVDENGVVTEVHPHSGDVEVDRLLARTWRQARFEPYSLGECRAPAWIQVPQNFRTDHDNDRRTMQVDAHPIAPSPPRP